MNRNPSLNNKDCIKLKKKKHVIYLVNKRKRKKWVNLFSKNNRIAYQFILDMRSFFSWQAEYFKFYWKMIYLKNYLKSHTKCIN